MKYLKYFIPIWGLFKCVEDDEFNQDYQPILMLWYHFIAVGCIVLGAYKLIQLL